MRIRIVFMSIIAAIFLTSCSHRTAQIPKSNGWDGDIVVASYHITNNLENNLKAPISPEDSIIVASFVDVSDLNKSSPFGRIMAEQIGSRLSQKGYKVIEMKLRQSSIFVDSENRGEFLLSRNLQDISRNHNASAVVVGTYAQGYERIYVTARIINPQTSVILTSYDYELHFPDYKQMNVLMRD
jgi:TolB-like protein